MVKRSHLLNLPVLALLLLLGCKHGGGACAGKALAETAIVAAAVTTQAVAAAAASRESSSGSSYNDPDPPPDPDPGPPPLPPFDEAEARAELRNADLSACVPTRETKVHARVTFDPEGPVAQVVVDEPHDLPEPLSRCVGAALSSAHVYAFTPANGTDASTTINLTLRSR